MIYYYPISLGHNCMPAHHLSMLGLRTQSLPFDWLYTPSHLAIEYVSELIETRFQYFLDDLEYNEQNFVISRKYPQSQFIHHDFLENINSSEDTLESTLGNQTLAFRRRADRFLDLITHQSILFVNTFSYSRATIERDATFFWDSVERFVCLLNDRGVDAKLLVIVYDNTDFELNQTFMPVYLPDNTYIRKFTRDTSIHPVFGCKKAFGKVLQEFLPTLNLQNLDYSCV